jgi:C_GCAxxG_C_C family probable redox protein
MLKDTAKRIYLEDKMNCAEATLRATNRDYGLGLEEGDFNLIGGFGAGCGCGNICGAVAGGVATIGRMTTKTKATETPELMDRCAAFIGACESKLGSVLCSDLKVKDYNDKTRCSAVVVSVNEILEDQIKDF